MDDLRAANVDLLTLGQYLRPTMHHLPVQRFVTPAEFDTYRQWALAKGFRECVSGPLVRSSYRAEQALAGNNAGLVNGESSASCGKSGLLDTLPVSPPVIRRRIPTFLAGTARPLAGKSRVRTHLARNAAHHRHARCEHAG